MRRGPGRVPSAVSTERTTPGMIDEVRTYEFLTPVFGGGVKVEGQHKRADPVTPVRAASIRGQLRFWWRACNPRGCQTPEELRAKEDAVFGSTVEPSQLSVEVVEQPAKPEELRVLALKEGKSGRAIWEPAEGMRDIYYGAFPLRDTRTVDQRQCDHGVLHTYAGKWTIRLHYSSQFRPDLAAALWAWAHFGGLGGRTRRGFGAISQREPRTLPSVQEGWASYVSGLQVPWPHLPPWMDAKPPVLTYQASQWKGGLDAQKYLLGKLRALRQGREGRNRGETSRPGRSFWPEPDAIRRRVRSTHPQHEPELQVNAFPRAAFGLPIIFSFKKDDERKGDPPPTMLVPWHPTKQRNRWASPLVLRPHQCHKGIEALALFLLPQVTDADRDLELRCDSTGKEWRETRALSPEGAREIRPMGRTATDPLDRFREFFNE